MDDIYNLVENLKKLVKNANAAEEPMSTNFAEVKSTSPLKLDMGGFTVSAKDELFVVTGTIKKLIDDNKLKKGDSVLCLQEPGGENWIIIDTVEVDD